MLKIFKILILLAIIASNHIYAPNVCAQDKIRDDLKDRGDALDSFQTIKKHQVYEKEHRIKRHKIQTMRAIPLRAFAQTLKEDGRIDKFILLLEDLDRNDADSCTACWSVYNKLLVISRNVRGSTTKAKSTDDEVKDETLVVEPVSGPRAPRVSVIESTRRLFVELAASTEYQLIFDSLQILVDRFTSGHDMTPAESEYFSTLAFYMVVPFADIHGEEYIIDMELD